MLCCMQYNGCNLSPQQSPPVTNVATQSEPLPLSFHLDSLLNCRYITKILRILKRGIEGWPTCIKSKGDKIGMAWS